MCCMRRQNEEMNMVIPAEFDELNRAVRVVSVKNQQAMCIVRLIRVSCLWLKMLLKPE
jgi:hypothetical protein